jgi:hypothetical protein
MLYFAAMIISSAYIFKKMKIVSKALPNIIKNNCKRKSDGYPTQNKKK